MKSSIYSGLFTWTFLSVFGAKQCKKKKKSTEGVWVAPNH